MLRFSLALALTACFDPFFEDAPPPAPVQSAETRSPAVRGHMQEHSIVAQTASAAVLQGRLEDARTALKTLARHDAPADWPHSATPAALAMRMAAQDGATAQTLEQAGVALGKVAQSCGTCHAQLDGGAVPHPEGLEDMDANIRSHMARHLWAIDRLWEGLTVPREKNWAVGLEVLAEEHVVELPTGVPATLQQHGVAVHTLAAADDVGARGAQYGRILAACGGCHGPMGIRFGTPTP